MTKRKTNRTSIWGMVVCGMGIAATLGCGDGRLPTYAASGTVVYTDGKPLPGGFIVFTSDKHDAIQARGSIDESGKFSLGTYDRGDGAVVGTHQISIRPPTDNPDAPPTHDIDRRFYRPALNDLLFEVTEDGPNDFEVKVGYPKHKQPKNWKLD